MQSSAERTVIEEAQALIYGGREQDYGPPTQSFDSIARLWTAYLETKFQSTVQPLNESTLDIVVSSPQLNAVDVAHMMVLLKVSRGQTGGYKRDTYADIAGYAGCVERIVEDK